MFKLVGFTKKNKGNIGTTFLIVFFIFWFEDPKFIRFVEKEWNNLVAGEIEVAKRKS